MRLIDADALAEEIKSLQVFVTGIRAGKGILNEYAKQYRESLLRTIEEQPTAYDVDKVDATIKEYAEMPKVEVNDKTYVDKEIFVGYALRLLNAEIKDALSDDEKRGIEVAMKVISNI